MTGDKRSGNITTVVVGFESLPKGEPGGRLSKFYKKSASRLKEKAELTGEGLYGIFIKHVS